MYNIAVVVFLVVVDVDAIVSSCRVVAARRLKSGARAGEDELRPHFTSLLLYTCFKPYICAGSSAVCHLRA